MEGLKVRISNSKVEKNYSNMRIKHAGFFEKSQQRLIQRSLCCVMYIHDILHRGQRCPKGMQWDIMHITGRMGSCNLDIFQEKEAFSSLEVGTVFH